MRRWILIICCRDIFFRKYGIERCHNFSYHLISVSALRCETGNTKITSFHVSVVCYFANKHTKTCQNITWSQTDYPSFTKKQRYASNMTKASNHLICTHSTFIMLPWYRIPSQFWECYFGLHWNSANTMNEISCYSISTYVHSSQRRC